MSQSTRRSQVMVGDLPTDFLRINGQSSQELEDERIAQILQAQQQAGVGVIPSNTAGRLNITVVEAKLVKNYGLTKMDPYCRVRLGHAIFETPTAVNGAKMPRWNKTVQALLPSGVDSIYVELFDERSFTMDDRIAWAQVTIPPDVLNGETGDDWFPLSGRQGDEKEGAIHFIMSFTDISTLPESQYNYGSYPSMMYYPGVQPVVVRPGIHPGMQPVQPGMMQPGMQPPGMMPAGMQPGMMPAGMQPGMMPAGMQQQPMYPPQQLQQGPPFTAEDLQQAKDMFPNMEEEVIKSVFEANRGNKDATINSLLSMTSD